MNQPRKIRWLIAHEPVNLFLKTANAFSDKIAELTHGQFEVEIKTSSGSEFFGVFGDKIDPIGLMQKGDLEMSQMHVSEIARHHSSPDFFALDLPFLFRDHDHAAKVLDGEIGQNLLQGLSKKTSAMGLAFTYSGGFRCVVSETKLSTIEDFKGIKFATTFNPVSVDTVESIGAVPECFSLRDFAERVKAEGSTAEALETTIPRYLAQFKGTNKKYMLNTKHSLFLTTIVISNDFWNSLDAETQQQFREAVLHVSKLERQWSVEESESFANGGTHIDLGVGYKELGVEYSELDVAEITEFKKLTAPLFDKYKDFFEPGLIDGIIRS
jgi:TRAP-type C4-dicarboxylate transport system substrate-binding protein